MNRCYSYNYYLDYTPFYLSMYKMRGTHMCCFLLTNEQHIKCCFCEEQLYPFYIHSPIPKCHNAQGTILM